MPTRNTAVLQQILEALGIAEPHALAKPEDRFKDLLLVVAGDVNLIASQAKELRLAITPAKRAQVLDHLNVRISLDQTEEAIKTLFTGRFIEP